MKKIFFFFFIFIIFSCKTTYMTKPFVESEIPKEPNYSNLNSWIAHPKIQDSILNSFYPENIDDLKADVFYIYPTLITDKNNISWNADIYNKDQNSIIRNTAIQYQASAWAKAGRIYSPLYRQAHYRVFFEPYTSNGGLIAGEIAYNDIKKAFTYYINNLNKGRPIIIAGHSQGAVHCKMLLRDFFDGKDLKDRLIAAYLIGTSIKKDYFNDIKPMYSPTENKGYVTWNTFRRNKKPRKNIDPAYFSWKNNSVVVNPITWDNSNKTDFSQHMGLLFYDTNIYPQSIKISVEDGIIWSNVPRKIPKRILLSLIKNYHVGDINFFWKDISENAVIRTQNFYNLSSKNIKL